MVGDVLEITALLGNLSTGKVMTKGEFFGSSTTYSVSGELAAWRHPSGTLSTDPVSWHFSSSREQDTEPFAPWTCVRMRVERKAGRFYVKDLLDADADDPQLRAMAEDLRKPIVIEDPIFGQLICDPNERFFEFRTTIDVGRDKPEVVIPPAGRVPDETALAAARALAREKDVWRGRIFEALTDQLLEDCWLQQDRRIDREAFQTELRLVTLDFNAGADTFTAWFDGGELYYGHGIHVEVSISGGITSDAQIYG